MNPSRREPAYTAQASTTPPKPGELRNSYEAELLHKDGWAMRSYMHCCDHEIADHRTVGLLENFDHPDFQIFFPLQPQIALNILFTTVELVQQGQKFKDGDTSTDILDQLTVKIVSATVDGQQMLRIILPDKQGRYEKDEMSEPYSAQYSDL